MPNGTFFRLVRWIVAKSTNMPWAVSGRSQTTAPSSSTGPACVLNMRLKFRGSESAPPQSGQTIDASSPAAIASSRWSARKRL